MTEGYIPPKIGPALARALIRSFGQYIHGPRPDYQGEQTSLSYEDWKLFVELTINEPFTLEPGKLGRSVAGGAPEKIENYPYIVTHRYTLSDKGKAALGRYFEEKAEAEAAKAAAQPSIGSATGTGSDT